tara:strand:+ start:655 stop:903 length:249 start_codon:yes stop_codon:yes gene_type:complete
MSNPTNPLSSQLIRATLARFEAQRQEALAALQLYLGASVGVGDHPDIVTELCDATRSLAEAEEALDALERHLLTPETANDEE